MQINPIWSYGPYDPSPVTAGSQPDWYMGFADGALRLLPGWLEFSAFGYTLSLNIALGALVLLPLVYIGPRHLPVRRDVGDRGQP